MTPTLPDNPEKHSPSKTPQRKQGTILRTVLVVTGLCALLLISVAIGVGIRALRAGHGEVGGPTSLLQETVDLGQIAINPKQGFPGKNKIVICCMGIDDNWTNSDEVYTVGSRTDTLFLLTLDLVNKKATMLSIPRDTYVPIAGTNYSSKINSAFATGGPKRTEATIQNWLGVTPDYYIVLNIDATKKMVDALGGIDLNVEHKMDYDDNWGHLHVHLMPGMQHLTGDEAVSFARYRHGNKGVTPEDGDERRMYRQHVLMRAMIDKAKSFASVLQANQLIDVGMSTIRTDMTRTQLFDLAAIFHKLDQDDMLTASLAGEDGRLANGVYTMIVDKKEASEYVDWLVNGNENAGRALTPVVVESSLPAGTTADAIVALKAAGYTDCKLRNMPEQTAGSLASVAQTSSPTTTIIDGGVTDRSAPGDIKSALGVSNAAVVHQVVKPNKFGWSPPAAVTVILGSDYASSAPAQSAPTVQ